MVFNTLIPEVKIITPVRDMTLSREAEIKFLKENGVQMNFEKAKYSINSGIWGTSVGGKETLSSHTSFPEEAWPSPATKKEKEDVTLHFEKGELTGVNDQTFTPVKAIQYLNTLATGY